MAEGGEKVVDPQVLTEEFKLLNFAGICFGQIVLLPHKNIQLPQDSSCQGAMSYRCGETNTSISIL